MCMCVCVCVCVCMRVCMLEREKGEFQPHTAVVFKAQHNITLTVIRFLKEIKKKVFIVIPTFKSNTFCEKLL